MKAYCNVLHSNPNINLSFAHQHMFAPFKVREPACYTNDDHHFEDDTTHYIIMDLGASVQNNADKILKFRKNGGKVVLMFFDPISFPTADKFVENGMLDLVVVFDAKFKNRFPNVKTIVSDYFFDQELFPISPPTDSKKVCVFGHIAWGRENFFGIINRKLRIDKVDTNVKSYPELYRNVQQYNGVVVFDTGAGEDGKTIVGYNKAKAVETLMTGRNAFCQDNINTKRYNEFLIKPYDSILNVIPPINIDQTKIFEINNLTINELIDEIKKL